MKYRNCFHKSIFVLCAELEVNPVCLVFVLDRQYKNNDKNHIPVLKVGILMMT